MISSGFLWPSLECNAFCCALFLDQSAQHSEPCRLVATKAAPEKQSLFVAPGISSILFTPGIQSGPSDLWRKPCTVCTTCHRIFPVQYWANFLRSTRPLLAGSWVQIQGYTDFFCEQFSPWPYMRATCRGGGCHEETPHALWRASPNRPRRTVVPPCTRVLCRICWWQWWGMLWGKKHCLHKTSSVTLERTAKMIQNWLFSLSLSLSLSLSSLRVSHCFVTSPLPPQSEAQRIADV